MISKNHWRYCASEKIWIANQKDIIGRRGIKCPGCGNPGFKFEGNNPNYIMTCGFNGCKTDVKYV
jgi:hypothetical protein